MSVGFGGASAPKLCKGPIPHIILIGQLLGPSIHPSVCLSVCSSVDPSVDPSVRWSVCRSFCPSFRWFVGLSVRQSVGQSIHQSVRWSIGPSVRPFGNIQDSRGKFKLADITPYNICTNRCDGLTRVVLRRSHRGLMSKKDNTMSTK